MIQTVFGFDFGLNIQMEHQSLILLSLSFSSINKKDRPHTQMQRNHFSEMMASGIICYRKQLSSITQVKFLNWKYRVDAKVRHQWRISIQRFTNQHENFRLFPCFLCVLFLVVVIVAVSHKIHAVIAYNDFCLCWTQNTDSHETI